MKDGGGGGGGGGEGGGGGYWMTPTHMHACIPTLDVLCLCVKCDSFVENSPLVFVLGMYVKTHFFRSELIRIMYVCNICVIFVQNYPLSLFLDVYGICVFCCCCWWCYCC